MTPPERRARVAAERAHFASLYADYFIARCVNNTDMTGIINCIREAANDASRAIAGIGRLNECEQSRVALMLEQLATQSECQYRKVREGSADC